MVNRNKSAFVSCSALIRMSLLNRFKYPVVGNNVYEMY
jgi:hypothetical protein